MANISFYDKLNIPRQHFQNFDFHSDFINLPLKTKVDIFAATISTKNKRITLFDAKKWYNALTGAQLALPLTIPYKNILTVASLIEIMQENGFAEAAAALEEKYNGNSNI